MLCFQFIIINLSFTFSIYITLFAVVYIENLIIVIILTCDYQFSKTKIFLLTSHFYFVMQLFSFLLFVLAFFHHFHILLNLTIKRISNQCQPLLLLIISKNLKVLNYLIKIAFFYGKQFSIQHVSIILNKKINFLLLLYI